MFYEFLKDKVEKIISKLSDSINVLTVNSPYYSEVVLGFNFFKADNIPTIGVNVNMKGVNCYYNEKFVNSCPSQESVTFIMIHEIFHILFNHHKRTIIGKHDQLLANIVQDMIINQIIHDVIMGNEKAQYVEIPYEMVNGQKQNTAHFIPKEYTREPIFEKLYEWMKEQVQKEKDKRKKEGKSSQKGQGQQGSQGQKQPQKGGSDGQDGTGTPSDGKNSAQGQEKGQKGGSKSDLTDQKDKGKGKNQEKDADYGPNSQNGVGDHSLESKVKQLADADEGKEALIKTLDQHLEDEIPEEMREQIVQDIIARVRARGLKDGNSVFENALKLLRKSKKDYLKAIKKAVCSIKGKSKVQTWSRPNRKDLPTKGFKRRGCVLTAIIDTSGSMHGYHEKVVSYIFQNDIMLDLIQCDTKVQETKRVTKKNDLKKLKLKGFGGTVIQTAVEHAIKNHKRQNLVILTDGETDELDFTGFHGKVLILSCNKEVPVKAKPVRGLKQICIKE